VTKVDSRLLNNLNAQAGSTRDPVVWAMAVCRAASHFAGHGKTDEALTAIGVVRGQFGKDLHFDIASWLMLAEGVLHYFKAQIPEAYDRIRRAYGLAIALRNNSALPSCAAWMAHVEFNSCRYDEMVKHLEEALTSAKRNDHQAIARAALVMATAYHISGDFELSRPWYERARLNAAAEGDDATVSATLHNMASIRASNVRLDDSFGGDTSKETQRVTLEASSSFVYDYAIGHKGLDFLTQMLGGLIATIDQRFDDALTKFAAIEMEKVPERLRPLILIDKAWCQVRLGETSEGWETSLEVQRLLTAVKEDDDQAYIYSRLNQIGRACGNHSLSASSEVLAKDALARHRSFQTNLLSKLKAINVDGEWKSPA
jgi:Tetratricopeptide repeat